MSVEPQPSKAIRGLDRLLELQDLESAIDRLSARRDALEAAGELRSAREVARAAEDHVGQLKLQVDQVGTHQRRLESDVDSMTQKMEGERKRLYDGTVANPKELQSIEHEVANLHARIGRIEDEQLELMERREDLERSLVDAETEAAGAAERVAQIERTSAGELLQIERELEERRSARIALVPMFDEDLLDLYEELRRSKKGIGVAALVDSICQGCHEKLSPVYLAGLRRSDPPWRCEYCRRILIES